MGKITNALAAAAVRLVAGQQIKNADRIKPSTGKHTKKRKGDK
jgi:hypothetical protein